MCGHLLGPSDIPRKFPLLFSGHHLNYDDFLGDKRENDQNCLCCVVYDCIMCKHI